MNAIQMNFPVAGGTSGVPTELTVTGTQYPEPLQSEATGDDQEADPAGETMAPQASSAPVAPQKTPRSTCSESCHLLELLGESRLRTPSLESYSATEAGEGLRAHAPPGGPSPSQASRGHAPATSEAQLGGTPGETGAEIEQPIKGGRPIGKGKRTGGPRVHGTYTFVNSDAEYEVVRATASVGFSPTPKLFSAQLPDKATIYHTWPGGLGRRVHKPKPQRRFLMDPSSCSVPLHSSAETVFISLLKRRGKRPVSITRWAPCGSQPGVTRHPCRRGFQRDLILLGPTPAIVTPAREKRGR
ncbi:unnamed protein product [Gadus morhua 'NCC']